MEHSQNYFFVYARKHKPVFKFVFVFVFVFASGPKDDFVSLHKRGS